jgi:hypothetical protein
MERKLRLAAPAAGGAFLFSLLIAMVAGVPFATALLRSLVGGAAFFGVAFGVVALVETLLPDLLTASGGSDSSDSDDFAGTVGAGNRQEGPGSTPDGDDGEFDEDSVADTGNARQSGTAADEGPAPGSRLDIVVEDDDEDESAEELVEEVQESAAEDEGEIMTAAISEEQDGTSVEIDDTMLDEMPDIGSFAGSFVSSEFGDAGDDETGGGAAGARPSPSGGGRQKVGDPRKGFENAEIAKALHTMLERDGGS